MVGALTTVAFEAHAGELATIAPKSIATVYEHYSMVGRAREGIRALGPPGTHIDQQVREDWTSPHFSPTGICRACGRFAPAVSPRGTSSGVREPFAHRETGVRVGGWVVR